MTTLEQVHLLEEKVERAVAKMQQLQAENDALRNKCAELTNALSSKTEQLSSFNSNKDEIEDGIKKALDRLNFIENTVLKTSATVNPNGQASIQITPGVSKINEEELNKVQKLNNAVSPASQQITSTNFDTMKPSPSPVDMDSQFSEQEFNMEPEFDLLGEDIDDMPDDSQFSEMEDLQNESAVNTSNIPFGFDQMSPTQNISSQNVHSQASPIQTAPAHTAAAQPAPINKDKKPDIF